MKSKQTTKFAAGLAALLATAALVGAVDAVVPATASVALKRGENMTALAGQFYKGTTLLLTNMQTLADSAGTVTQGLDGVTVLVTVGSVGATTVYTGTVYNATAGLFSATVAVPTNAADNYIQVKLIDSATNSYIYPWISFSTKDALQ